LDLVDEKTLEVSISLIDLLHFNKHRCLHIGQPNGDGLHLIASTHFNRSSFSAITSLQKAEILRQRLLYSSSITAAAPGNG